MAQEEGETRGTVAPGAEAAPPSTSSSSPTIVHHGRGAVGHGLYWPQNHELLESSIPDLLAVVARNALLVLPSERCVVFMYDKSTNLLSAQVSCDGRVVQDAKPSTGSENTAESAAVAPNESSDDEDEELSFPPVMGLVSACFLQRRCLRMQEPNLHKSFHREYDVPKHVSMNSIIAAPVTLHHRTVGVIELLNRIDPDAPSVASDAPQEEPSANSSLEVKPITGDEENEVKLTRTKAVQQRARIGFSAKDEQKMIQFTSHVAQLLDNKLKLLAQVESAAKHREEQARTAMELLEMMNQKLEYRPHNTPVEEPAQRLTKRRSSTTLHALPVEWTPEQLHEEETEDTPAADGESVAVEEEERDQVLLLSDVDMMKVMVGISRTQAVFRGHHLRKVHRLSEALQQHRIMRRRVKSALVIQRATRRFLARRWRKKRRNAVWRIVRAIKSYQLRAALAERIQIKKRQKRKRSVVVDAKPREGGHHKLVESDVHQFRERFASALKIQQQFRGHKARKQIERIVGFKDLTKGLKNIVKLQSILRGTMARKQVEKIREEKRTARAANVVCLRLASSESSVNSDAVPVPSTAHHALNSRDCLYPLPPLPNGASVAANRITSPLSRASSERETDERSTGSHFHSRAIARPHHVRRRRLTHAGETFAPMELDSDSWIGPSTRPLAPSPLASPRTLPERSPLILPSDVHQPTRAELMRQHPEVVFELNPKRSKRCPAGVQLADDWLPRRPHRPKTTRWNEADETRDTEDTPISHIIQDGRKHALVAAKRTPGLPQLMAPHRSSNQLHVCFVPAGNVRRPTLRLSQDGSLTSRPPTQAQRPESSVPPLRRPLTTR